MMLILGFLHVESKHSLLID